MFVSGTCSFEGHGGGCLARKPGQAGPCEDAGLPAEPVRGNSRIRNRSPWAEAARNTILRQVADGQEVNGQASSLVGWRCRGSSMPSSLRQPLPCAWCPLRRFAC